MSFEPKKYQDIFEAMRERSSVITDFEVGSVARTVYESFAYELALLYEKMNLVYLSAFVDTAKGQQLDNVVSVLGITRSLPDFSEGVVRFFRDTGNEDIIIPLGTLVATEDAEENPKKVYQTIEAKTLVKDQTSIDVKVQAIKRGNEEDSPAETVVVMPRPLPGIKSVINTEEIKLVGKGKETDEALRQRAKNALISSGKATITSIENALLSLPKVKDVQVKEDFHFASGELLIERPQSNTNDEVLLPRGTRFLLNTLQRYELLEDKVLSIGDQSIIAKIRALDEGEIGIVSEASSNWTIDSDDPIFAPLSLQNTAPILLGDFGVIEVFVDGPDLSDPNERNRIMTEIDRVRAAGIFVILKAPQVIEIAGIFQVELSPQLNLTIEEREEFEQSVQAIIQQMIDALKVGEAFQFSKLINQVLSIEGVENLEDFQITTQKGEEIIGPLGLADKSIEVDADERLLAKTIGVASENKSLVINLEYEVDIEDEVLSSADVPKTAIIDNLKAFFNGLKLGDPVKESDLQVAVTGSTLRKFTPLSWTPRALIKTGQNDEPFVDVSFVEKAVLGNVFVYARQLLLTGALRLVLPDGINAASKNDIRAAVLEKVDNYLDQLVEEEDLHFEALAALASEVNEVLAVEIEASDFSLNVPNTSTPLDLSNRILDDKIEVMPFEKLQLNKDSEDNVFICISDGIEPVLVEVDDLRLDLFVTNLSDAEINSIENNLKTTVSQVIDNYISDLSQGEDLDFADFKSAIEGAVPGLNYLINILNLSALSQCDQRKQNSDNNSRKDIRIRSIEKATFGSIISIAINTTNTSTS